MDSTSKSAEACEMAQPLPSNGVDYLAFGIYAQGHFDMIAAERVVILEMDIVRVEVATVLGVLVMVND